MTKRDLIKILDINIDHLTKADAITRLNYFLELKTPSIICTPNVEFVMKAQDDLEFKNILNTRSRLNLPDGIGILWAGKFLAYKSIKTPIIRELFILLYWVLTLFLLPFFPKYFQSIFPEKISGSDFIWDLARWAAANKLKVFLFGGAPTVAERTALKLQTDIYDLRISGIFSGGYDEVDTAIENINKSRADILILCLGAPRQEKWLANNLSKTNCKIGIGLGGTFDFISGEIKRAPVWMQRSGLEWFYRLLSNPTRFKRQIVLPQFIIKVLMLKLRTK